MTGIAPASTINKSLEELEKLDDRIHALKDEILTIFKEKEIEEVGYMLYNYAANYVANFSANSNVAGYKQYIENIEAVLANVSKMGKRKIQQFKKASLRWQTFINANYGKNGKRSQKQYQKAINAMFNMLFENLGTPGFKRHSIIEGNKKEIANTFNKNKKDN